MESATIACHYCGSAVDPSSHMTYRRVVGWERKAAAVSRKSGSDIALREPHDQYACWSCVDRLRAGLNVNQDSLL